MHSMKAIRIHDYGGPEVVRLEEVARPVPGPGEVLVRLQAASVNPVDWKIRDGMLRERLPIRLPMILGGDFAGIVADLGPGAAGFKPGAAVFGMTHAPGFLHSGAYAEYLSARTADIAAAPRMLSPIEAASVPLAALTAWQALFDRARLTAGQRVLVHGGAGGVGSFAIQFAKHAGAWVATTASPANAEYVRGLGADEVIDYRAVAFETVLRELDVVLDLIGEDVQRRSYGVLRRGGVLVNAWGAIMQDAADAAGVRGVKVAVEPHGAQLREIAGLIDAGKVRTAICEIYPLSEAAAALEHSKTGHARGKIVLEIAAA